MRRLVWTQLLENMYTGRSDTGVGYSVVKLVEGWYAFAHTRAILPERRWNTLLATLEEAQRACEDHYQTEPE